MYIWNSNLETGNANIDNQHKELINALNELIKACMQLKGGEKLTETMDFLVAYVNRHFADEERLQLQSGYPEFTRHKMLHDQFKKDITLMANDIRKNPGNTVHLTKLTNTIGDWLLNHIRVEDVSIAKHITQQNNK